MIESSRVVAASMLRAARRLPRAAEIRTSVSKIISASWWFPVDCARLEPAPGELGADCGCKTLDPPSLRGPSIARREVGPEFWRAQGLTLQRTTLPALA